MGRKKFKIPGVSFSAKRALGISQAQSKLSRKIGIPLSKSGRQQKLGSAMGCSVMIIPFIGTIVLVGYFISS